MLLSRSQVARGVTVASDPDHQGGRLSWRGCSSSTCGMPLRGTCLGPAARGLAASPTSDSVERFHRTGIRAIAVRPPTRASQVDETDRCEPRATRVPAKLAEARESTWLTPSRPIPPHDAKPARPRQGAGLDGAGDQDLGASWASAESELMVEGSGSVGPRPGRTGRVRQSTLNSGRRDVEMRRVTVGSGLRSRSRQHHRQAVIGLAKSMMPGKVGRLFGPRSMRKKKVG